MQTRQILRFPSKVSVSLQRHTFLRINSRNQPFIYLQSKDILGFDNEKIFNIILNFQLGNQCEKVYLNAFGGLNYIRDVIKRQDDLNDFFLNCKTP